MFDGIYTVLSFIVALSILVAVHEFGHFYIARKCGVKVLRFSIGFGHRLYTWTDKQGTEFSFSVIPLGGYVKMLDEREGDVEASELDQAYSQKQIWQRVAILLAGPLANFILAVVLYWLLFLQGVTALSPIIGSVEAGSIAAEAGLEAGQEILAIDGQLTPSRRAVNMYLLNRLGETGDIAFTVKYPDSSLEYESRADLVDWLKGVEAPDMLKGLGLTFYYPEIEKIIDEVLDGSAAQKAGFKSGDELLAVDGQTLSSWREWVEYVRARPDIRIDVLVTRAGQELTLVLTPERIAGQQDGKDFGRAGVSVVIPEFPEEMVRKHEFGVIGAFIEACGETWNTSISVLVSLKKLILGQISTKNLSGPIGIAKVAGDSARAGIWSFIEFLGMISIYLGVFNLLPVPVLDGGRILYCFAEWVKGSPLSERAEMLGMQAGLAVILCVMVVAFYNDILRL